MSIAYPKFEGAFYPHTPALEAHFRRNRFDLTCDLCDFSIPFVGSEAAAKYARLAGWEEFGEIHVCNVCKDKLTIRALDQQSDQQPKEKA